jgi:hypothetical protein
MTQNDVFLPDGTINMDSIRGALDAQAKQRIVHTAQDPREGIKFIQENAKKKNTSDLPVVLRFPPGVETDPLVGHGQAKSRVANAWGAGAAANDSVVRFPRNYEIGEVIQRRDSKGQIVSLEVVIVPKISSR